MSDNLKPTNSSNLQEHQVESSDNAASAEQTVTAIVPYIVYPVCSPVISHQPDSTAPNQNEQHRSVPDQINGQSRMTELGESDLTALQAIHKLGVSTLFEMKEPLNQSNYEIWSRKFESKMRDRNLVSLIKSKWTAAAMSKPAWVDLDVRAQDNILENIESCLQSYVLNKRTAYEMYEKLKEHFEGSVIIRGWRLCKQLTDLLSENKTEQLNVIAFKYQDLVDKLSKLFPLIPSEFYVSLYCSVLPAEYDYILSDILNQPNVTYEDVVRHTMSAFSRKQEHKGDQHVISNIAAIQSSAPAARKDSKPKGGNRKKGKGEKPKMLCTYCQMSNHIRDSCKFLSQDIISGKVRPENAATAVRPASSVPAAQPKNSNSQQQNGTVESFEMSPIIVNVNAASQYNLDPSKVYIDTAAGGSVTNSMSGCTAMFKSDAVVRSWNNREDKIHGVGTFCYVTETGCELKIDNMIYKENAAATFLSWGKMDRTGLFRMEGEGGQIKVFSKRTGALVFTAKLTGMNLYECDFKPNPKRVETVQVSKVTISPTVPVELQYRYWHDTLGHASFGYLTKCRHLLGIKETPRQRLTCDICAMAKGTKLPFPPSEARALNLFDLIHTDLSGIIRISNLLNVNYFVIFVDDYSRYISVFLISRKFQVAECYRQYQNWAAVQFNKQIKIVRSDNGTEFVNQEMTGLIEKQGTIHQLTAHGNPQQNGRSERPMRSIDEMARALLKAAGLSVRFWPFAVLYAVWLKNRLPHAGIDFAIPYRVMFGKDPVYKDMIKFGALVFVLDLAHKLKFENRSRPALFLGYPDNVKGYRVYLLNEQRVDTVAHIYLSEDAHSSEIETSTAYQPDRSDSEVYAENEDHLLAKRLFIEENESSAEEAFEQIEPLLVNDDELSDSSFVSAETGNIDDQFSADDLSLSSSSADHQSDLPSVSCQSNGGAFPAVEPEHSQTTSTTEGDSPDPNLPNAPVSLETPRELRDCIDMSRTDHSEQPKGRIIMNKREKEWFKQVFPDANFISSTPFRTHKPGKHSIVTIGAIQTPRSFKEATTGHYKHIFGPAMDREMAAQIKNKAWKVVPRPPNVKVLPTIWLYKFKTDSHGLVTGGKARLVVLGNHQTIEIGENNYSPVLHHTAFKIVASVAVKNGWPMHHIDCDTAFLNASVKGKIYVAQAPGYEVPGDGEQLVYELDKSVYGLRQSARQWFLTLKKALCKMGFKQLLTDRCVFKRKINGDLIIVAAFVDDLLLTTSNEKQLDWFKAEFAKHFSFKDHGQIKLFLGISFNYDREKRTLEMDQTEYIEQILIDAGFDHCKKSTLPARLIDIKQLTTADAPESSSSNSDLVDIDWYRHTMGQLMYLSGTYRFDIAYIVSILCSFMQQPAAHHAKMLKQLLRYLHLTKGYKLIYSTSNPLLASQEGVVVYADSSFESEVSRLGVLTFVNGNLVSWTSKKQSRVATSTCESEILSILDATNEVEYVTSLLAELDQPQLCENAAVIFNDNYSAKATIETGGQFDKNKHYKNRVCRIMVAVEDELIRIEYVGTKMMLADMLTKALNGDIIAQHCGRIGLK